MPLPSMQVLPTYSQSLQDKPLPIYFSDPALQGLFDELGGTLEFEVGIERNLAELMAKEEVSLFFIPMAQVVVV